MIATTSLRGKGSSGEPSELKNPQSHNGDDKSFQMTLNKRAHPAAERQRPDLESLDDVGEPIIAATTPANLSVAINAEVFTIEQGCGFPCSERETPIQLSSAGPSKVRNARTFNAKTHSNSSKGGNHLLTDRDSQNLLSFEPSNAAKAATLFGDAIPFPMVIEFALRAPSTAISGTDSSPSNGQHLLTPALVPVHIPEKISSIAINLNSERAGDFTIRICQRRDELDVMIYFKDAEFLDKFQGQRDLVMTALRNENLPVAALNLYDMGKLPLIFIPTKKGIRSGLTSRNYENIVSTEINLTADPIETSKILKTITDFIERESGAES